MTTRARPGIRTLRHDPHQQPFIVIWEVTRACELVCSHCRADAIKQRHPAELDTEAGRGLLDEIATFGPPRPLVVLTGGDPFERDDLAELVAHGTAAGLSMALSPSVTPQLTTQSLQELKDAGAKAISLSLDGASAATHDGFRGVEGVFAATLEAAETIRRLGFRLQLNTTVTTGTVDELPDVLRLVQQLQAALWSVFFLVPTGRGEQLVQLDADQVEDVLHWLYDVSHHLPVKTTEAPHYRRVALQRTRSGQAPPAGRGPLYRQLRTAAAWLLDDPAATPRPPRPPLDVNAGRGFVFVDHLGIVYPSGFLPLPAGSVRERSLPDIYRNAPLLRQLRDPSLLTGRCGRCEFVEVCGGSRSRAHAQHDDPFAEEPTCVHEPTPAA